jgi:hypothetical protein
MTTAAVIVTLLANRVSRGEHYRPANHSKELELVAHLHDTINDFLSCTSYYIDSSDTLDYDDSFEDDSDDSDDEEEDAEMEELDNSAFRLPFADNSDDAVWKSFSIDYMRKAVDFYDETDENGKRKHSWKSTKHRFRRIPYRLYLQRFRFYLHQQGTKRQKLDDVDSHIFSMFEDARHKSLAVHDADLQRWARQYAKEQSLSHFSASEHWVRSFKHRHNLVSRKITKFVTKHAVENEAEIAKSAEQFVAQVKAQAKSVSSRQILNTDQVGLEKELHSTRTISYRGEKLTVAAIKSMNAISHSFTVQPMINMAGEVVGPIFLCLQEPKGRISERKFVLFLFPATFEIFRPRSTIEDVPRSKRRSHLLKIGKIDHLSRALLARSRSSPISSEAISPSLRLLVWPVRSRYLQESPRMFSLVHSQGNDQSNSAVGSDV